MKQAIKTTIFYVLHFGNHNISSGLSKARNEKKVNLGLEQTNFQKKFRKWATTEQKLAK